ncbi:MAG: hypothetical protein ABUT20_07165 [Bacteroidota bacterium]
MKHFFLISDNARASRKDARRKDSPATEITELKNTHNHERNINEGAEFLDDNVQMSEQPLENNDKEEACGNNEAA